MHFLSFPFEENDESDITEPEGKFVESKCNRIPNQTVFGGYERVDYGTDLFIMGFDEDDGNWKNHLILSIVYNFFISIYQEKLTIPASLKKAGTYKTSKSRVAIEVSKP
ncbi:MAG: hypothetical protein ACTIKS_11075, partial [Lactococcus lactis]